MDNSGHKILLVAVDIQLFKSNISKILFQQYFRIFFSKYVAAIYITRYGTDINSISHAKSFKLTMVHLFWKPSHPWYFLHRYGSKQAQYKRHGVKSLFTFFKFCIPGYNLCSGAQFLRLCPWVS